MTFGRRRLCPLRALPLVLGLVALAFEAAAEEQLLSAAGLREALTGNSLISLQNGQVVDRRYLAPDGTTVFDPVRGFQVPGRWEIRNANAELCMWDLDPPKPYCARFAVEDGAYFLDWGDGFDRTFVRVIETGDVTDPSDNPGPNYRPHPDLPLPVNLKIRPPAPAVPDRLAALSGAWLGTIYNSRDYLIIVEAIDGAEAEIVYAWGPRHFEPDNPGWSRHRATIEDGVLTWEPVWGKVTAHLGDDGRLKVTFDWRDGGAPSEAIRWDDPSLEPQPPLEVVAPDPAKARDKLAFWDLQMAQDLGTDPLHNGYFMPLGEVGPAHQPFEGTLTVGESTVLGRSAGSRVSREQDPFPAFAVDFVTVGDRLVPRARDILRTARHGGRWNIILEPGRIWSETGDNGWSRASFPFLLTSLTSGDGHNGLATFLFNDTEVSRLRFQVVKEASAYVHLDLWGQAVLGYEAKRIDNRETLIEAFRQELSNRVEIRPWADLEARFGAEVVAPFDGTAIRPQISHSAVIVDGEVYATACRTRYGPYPYCREMRHSVFSVSKTLAGFLTLLHLAELYGEEVFDLKLVDYLDIAADHDGWKDVTFDHAISMVTGIGTIEPTRVDHYVEADRAPEDRRFWKAASAEEKLAAASAFRNYPWGPGDLFRYISSNTYILGAAMDAFLKTKQGPDARLWRMMNEDVFRPIGIRGLPAQHSIEEFGRPGLPIMYSGVYASLDDIAKIERLIRNQGRHEGRQLLHAEGLREVMEQGYQMGYPTGWRNEQGEVTYFRSFWYTPQQSRAGCMAPIPGMSGSGGNYVLLMPNGVTAVRFAGGNDNDDSSGTFDSSHMRKVADDIRPLCAP